jgi:uncharacterized membrane protein
VWLRALDRARLAPGAFAVLGLALALLYVAFQPPFVIYHEHDHLLRGLMLSPVGTDEELPVAYWNFVQETKAHNRRLGLNYQTGAIFSARPFERSAAAVALTADPNGPTFNPRPMLNPILFYPSIDYAPQVVAGTAGHVLGLRPALVEELARVCYLSVLLVGGYAFLRLLPGGRWAFALLLLLPSQWLLAVGQYPDVLVNVTALGFLALVLRARLLHEPLSAARVLGLALLGALLSVSKLVYFPLVLSVLHLGPECFPSRARRWLVLMLVVTTALGCALLQAQTTLSRELNLDLLATGQLAVTGHEWTASGPVSKFPTIEKGIERIVGAPLSVFPPLWRTFTSLEFWNDATRNLVGFWNPGVVRRGSALAIFVVLVLALVFVDRLGSPPNRSRRRIDVRDAVVATVVAAALLCLPAVSIWLAKGVDAQGRIPLLQGRYFMPLVMYLLFLSCAEDRRPARAQALSLLAFVAAVAWLGHRVIAG